MYDFTLLAFSGALPTGISASRDILMAAEALAAKAGTAKPKWRICSMQGGIVDLQGGLMVRTQKLPASAKADRSVWIVPGLAMDSADDIERRLACEDVQRCIKPLRQHLRLGGELAACCSGVFLLAQAGVLEQRKVTTAWWLAPYLQVSHPNLVVDGNRLIQCDGPITTAGAAFAQTDLMMHLLRLRMGDQLADLTEKMLLISRRESQANFVIPEMLARGDTLVQQIINQIEKALPMSVSVADLARHFGMSERTLSRHIHKATGKSTVALIQLVKLRRAKALLQQTKLTVEQIAEAVGYSDSTALRKVMKKSFGVAPAQLR